MKKIVTILCLILILTMAVPLQVFAQPSLSVSVPSIITPGGTFTATITGTDCVGRVNLSVSNGTTSKDSVWVEFGSDTVTITAGSSGSVTITATPEVGMSDKDFNEVSPSPASATVTISTPTPPPSSGTTSTPSSGSSSSSSSSSSGNRWDFEEENEGLPEKVDEEKEKEEPKKRPEVFEVSIGDKKYTIVETIKKGNAPDGFKLGKVKYTDWDVAAYINEDAKIVLICLKDKESGEEKLFAYNEADGSFSAELPISVDSYLEYLELKNQEPETNWALVVAGLMTLCAAAGGGCYYYFKVYKPKKTTESNE